MKLEPVVNKSSMQVRWLIRRDMPQVMAIEKAQFQNSHSEEEFLSKLRQRNTIGAVV